MKERAYHKDISVKCSPCKGTFMQPAKTWLKASNGPLLENVITGQDGNQHNNSTENPVINIKYQMETEAVVIYQIIYRFWRASNGGIGRIKLRRYAIHKNGNKIIPLKCSW